MFTGLVEAAVPVRSYELSGTGARLVLEVPEIDGWSVAAGDSVAVAGVCLTVLPEPDGMAFDLSRETLHCTWFSEARLTKGARVNVERALRVGDRLGGHMVSGHVDTVGRLTGRRRAGDGGEELRFEVPEGFERYLVDKGSVTIDGVSLTVVTPSAREFEVAVIPHTLEITQLGTLEPGDPVHLEADLVGKWVERLVQESPD